MIYLSRAANDSLAKDKAQVTIKREAVLDTDIPTIFIPRYYRNIISSSASWSNLPKSQSLWFGWNWPPLSVLEVELVWPRQISVSLAIVIISWIGMWPNLNQWEAMSPLLRFLRGGTTFLSTDFGCMRMWNLGLLQSSCYQKKGANLEKQAETKAVLRYSQKVALILSFEPLYQAITETIIIPWISLTWTSKFPPLSCLSHLCL